MHLTEKRRGARMYHDFDHGSGRERTAQMRKEVEHKPLGYSGAMARVSKEAPLMPKFDYHLDESDPDVLVLRRRDGSFVAAFSARGATRECIAEAAREDYAALLRENASSGPSRKRGPGAPDQRMRPIHRTS